MDINEQKEIVARFLRRCNGYADEMLARYADELARAGREGGPADADRIRERIGQWQSYRAFNEHALAELATDRLDDWFDGTQAS